MWYLCTFRFPIPRIEAVGTLIYILLQIPSFCFKWFAVKDTITQATTVLVRGLHLNVKWFHISYEFMSKKIKMHHLINLKWLSMIINDMYRPNLISFDINFFDLSKKVNDFLLIFFYTKWYFFIKFDGFWLFFEVQIFFWYFFDLFWLFVWHFLIF